MQKKVALTANEIQVIKMSEPNTLTNTCAAYPCTVVIVGMILQILIAVICGKNEYFEITEPHNREFMIFDSDMQKDWDQ
jgi:hypothetical protein